MLSGSLSEHLSDPHFTARKYPSRAPWRATGAANLALMTFIVEFNRRLHAYKRKDGTPVNARTFLIDPGFARTPGTRKYLTLGSLWGLLVYFLTWPLWWLVLKSPLQASQSFLFASMSPECGEGEGGLLYRECAKGIIRRGEVLDEDMGKKLWEASEKEIEDVERKSAQERNKQVKEGSKENQGRNKARKTEQEQKAK